MPDEPPADDGKFSVGFSRPKTMPTCPAARTAAMSSDRRTTATPSWWDRSACLIPRSVTTSSQRHGAGPLVQAVPSIMSSSTTVVPDAASPA